MKEDSWSVEGYLEQSRLAQQAARVQGRHYTGWVETIREFKAQGKLQEAEQLLLACVNATEGESKIAGYGVAPWYYEQLAIIYRKQQRYADEVAILERYMRTKHAPGAKPPKLADRLVKAREIQAAHVR